MSLARLFLLERDAVVTAGAGTGKTHSLVTLCLHLLGGVGRAEALAPARLCAVTFTEKAAAELRARVRTRLDGLADAASDGERRLREPDLFATLDARGAPPPDPAVWHKARRDLGQAQIGTLHSLCAQLLRRHAASAGLDPAFDLLDELESRALLRESCERAVLNALDGDGPARAAAERLVGEWNYRGQSKFVRGLADELEVLARLLAESGTTPAELVRAAPALDVEAALTAELAARRRLANALEELALAVRQSGSSSQTAQRWLEAAGAFAGVRDRVLACAPGELRAIWPLLEPVEAGVYAALHTKAGALKDAQVEARAAFEHLVACEADVRASRLAPELTLLSDRALALHADEKARAGVLEFDDLTRRARELLASRPEVRAAEQARFGAILVDEFQDTSRGQLDLLRHLAGDFTEGGRRLLVVGDWKQSIYEFRGADLSGVRGFAEGALRSGAEAFALRDSRRSMPALVDACNQLFQGVLGQGTEPFEAPFRPGTDDLVAVRQTRADAPRVELLSYEASASTLKGAPLEADSVARRIAALLTPEAPERVYDRRADGTEDARAPRGGDVAILLRSLTHIDDYRRALLRWRIPHVLFKGRGFHQTREVLDLRALLSLLFDDRDEAAIATVLRSPLGPLSDDALAILALTPKADEPPPEKPRPGRLRLPRLRDPLVLEQLAPDDRACAERLWSLIQRLRRASARLGPAALLEAALTETDFVASLGGGLFGEQAAANIGKLLDLARAVERKGGGVRDLLNRLDLLDDEVAGEPEAPVAEQTDPHAVRILTVHASKGLEFPIVVVPDCGAPSPNLQNRVLLDPDLGLALKVRTLTGKPGFGDAGGHVDQRRKAREQAESRRLLYVAATRARDLLVLSGLPARQPCWRTWLDAHLPRDPTLVRRIACDELPRLQSQSRRAPIETIEELEALASPPAQARPPPGVSPPGLSLAERRLGAPPAPSGTIDGTVSQLADAQACALRYHLLHELGLDERPQPPADRPAVTTEPDDATAPIVSQQTRLSASEQGTLAHRLLERLPLASSADEIAGALPELLRQEGADPAQHGELLASLEDLVRSPLGERLRSAERREGDLRRELPFALKLGPELVVHGQVDALLLEAGTATVIDYKHTEQRPVARYAAQLSAYALAAHQLLRGRAVQSGLVFLKSRGAFVAGPRISDANRAEAEGALRRAAHAIVTGIHSGEWPKAEPATCQSIDCGFYKRCHPPPAPG